MADGQNGGTHVRQVDFTIRKSSKEKLASVDELKINIYSKENPDVVMVVYDIKINQTSNSIQFAIESQNIISGEKVEGIFYCDFAVKYETQT